MKRVPPDYHISPVGTHAGDRISKKTVPGAFEVPRKPYEICHYSARSQVRDHSELLGALVGHVLDVIDPTRG
jgi:hypothetical protein